MYGPKGVGALAAARGVRARLTPLIVGGSQERGLRGGTLNTPAIVGFGAASRLALAERDVDATRQHELTSLLYDLLAASVGAQHNTQDAPRLTNTLNLHFAGAPADAVVTRARDVMVSAGSACHSGDTRPSHVLLAMGHDSQRALESLRLSVGRPTTEREVRDGAARLADAVDRVRELAATAQPTYSGVGR
jgi:cysteine desulfurase